MGVTAHYIDNDWVLQKWVIAFKVFDESHTVDNIYMMLKTIFKKYKFINKISVIGFDITSNNTVIIS